MPIPTRPAQQLAGSCYWAPAELFLLICENILAQAARAGFKALVADGHGPSRWEWARHVDRWEAQFGLKLISVGRDIPEGWRSQMDHAARNETSLMLALPPELVDLGQLSADRNDWPQGVGRRGPARLDRSPWRGVSGG